jgi:hypothetical protein
VVLFPVDLVSCLRSFLAIDPCAISPRLKLSARGIHHSSSSSVDVKSVKSVASACPEFTHITVHRQGANFICPSIEHCLFVYLFILEFIDLLSIYC